MLGSFIDSFISDALALRFAQGSASPRALIQFNQILAELTHNFSELSFQEFQEIFEIHRRARTVQNMGVFNTFSSWIVLYWAVLSCIELCWIAWSCIDQTYWTSLNSYWAVLTCFELSWAELHWASLTSDWAVLTCFEVRWAPSWASSWARLSFENYETTTKLPNTIYHLPLPSTITNRAPKWGHLIFKTLHMCTHSKQYSETSPDMEREARYDEMNLAELIETWMI